MTLSLRLARPLASLAVCSFLAVFLSGCPEKALGRVGDFCGDDEECASGLCIESVCLDPAGDEDGDGLTNGLEGSLRTNPLLADTDGDGKDDYAEVRGDEPPDTDGDGLLDAIESALPGDDGDRDCLPDELDPRNAVFDEDNARLAFARCTREGVCGANVELVVAVCLVGDGAPEVDCDYAGIATYEEFEQSCDTLDNDCDGGVDEELEAVADDRSICSRLGVCALFEGLPTASCAEGAWSCAYPGLDAQGFEGKDERSCDGLDNDCDGQTDDFPLDGAPSLAGASCGTGACAGGVVGCTADGAGLACSTTDLATAELCDGLDNDCDGLTDDDLTIDGAAIGENCAGVGACRGQAGLVECHPELGVVCSVNYGGSEFAGGLEVCDLLDNDCSGVVDDHARFEGGESPCPPFGVCADSTSVRCGEDATPVCEFAGIPDYEESEATCDEKDNDCNGFRDEGLPLDFALALAPVAAGVPTDRTGYAAALDPGRGRLVLVGGLAPSANPLVPGMATLVDTWERDTATGAWARIPTAPTSTPLARDGAFLVADPAGGRMLLGGGRDYTQGGLASTTGHGDLWSYDLTTHAWTRALPPGSLPGRIGATAVLGAPGELWIVGGLGSDTSPDTLSLVYVDLGATPPTALSAGVVAFEVATPALVEPAVAFDASTQRLYVYGGRVGGATATNAVFAIGVGGESPALVPLVPDEQLLPTPSGGAALAVTPAGDLVLFGGAANAPTWTLDIDPAEGPLAWGFWSQAPGAQPPVRSHAVLAVDEQAVAHLWLGDEAGLLFHDGWTAPLAARQWGRRAADASFPPPRQFAASAVDVEGGRWFVYGGATATTNGYVPRDDLWVLDLRTGRWERIDAPGGPLAVGAGAAFDPRTGTLLGYGGAALDGATVVTDVRTVAAVRTFWSLDVATGTWSGLAEGEEAPPALLGPGAVIEAEGDLLLYGGYATADGVQKASTAAPSAALWRYSLATGTWRALTPTGDAVTPRAGHFVAYDPELDKLLALGGVGGGDRVAVYEVGKDEWHEVAGVLPSEGLAAYGAYDATSDQAVVVLAPIAVGVPAGLRVSFSDPLAPVADAAPGLATLSSGLFAPCAYDVAGRRALVLGATDRLDGTPGGLYEVSQRCR